MARNTAGDAFSRDLGYLDAFFDKLDAHGAALGGVAGDRLRTFVGEERRRWAEVRSLLAGGNSTSVSLPQPTARVSSDVTPSRNAVASVSDPSTPTLTVGSLRSMRSRGQQS